MATAPRPLEFLCSLLEDPRRIELRPAEFAEAYYQRGSRHDMIEVVHDLTKLRQVDIAKVRTSATLFEQPQMQAVVFSQDRDYPLQTRIRLPPPTIPDLPFGQLVRSRRSARTFGGAPLRLNELGALLFGAIGETGRLVADQQDDQSIFASLRAIPSAGALHPTGIFAAIPHAGELARGIYHYDVAGHCLELVKASAEADAAALLAAFPIHPYSIDLTHASAIFFVASKFWRSRAKYGPRGYRYCLHEAGSACQNLSLTAAALGLAHVVLGGFYDDEVHACLDIDGIDHAAIAAIAVGSRAAEDNETAHHVGL
jgi:SagB-type dehydrogenase family enzyme